MALIPAQHMEPRDALSLRVDRRVHERLQQYAAFIRSPKDDVIAQALERLFHGDKECVKWLAARAREMPVVQQTADPAVGADTPIAHGDLSESGERGSRARGHRVG